MAIDFSKVKKIIGPGGKEVKKIVRTSDGVVLWQLNNYIIDTNGKWVENSKWWKCYNSNNYSFTNGYGDKYYQIVKNNTFNSNFYIVLPKEFYGRTLHIDNICSITSTNKNSSSTTIVAYDMAITLMAMDSVSSKDEKPSNYNYLKTTGKTLLTFIMKISTSWNDAKHYSLDAKLQFDTAPTYNYLALAIEPVESTYNSIETKVRIQGMSIK